MKRYPEIEPYEAGMLDVGSGHRLYWVSEMILVSVGTTTRHEVEWVTRVMGRVFPAEWARFRHMVPEAD